MGHLCMAPRSKRGVGRWCRGGARSARSPWEKCGGVRSLWDKHGGTRRGREVRGEACDRSDDMGRATTQDEQRCGRSSGARVTMKAQVRGCSGAGQERTGAGPTVDTRYWMFELTWSFLLDSLVIFGSGVSLW